MHINHCKIKSYRLTSASLKDAVADGIVWPGIPAAASGLDEKRILALNPVVDAYGVGTSITNARVIDFAMDIVEMDGKPLAKRGKMSGSKSVSRCSKCFQDRMVPFQKNRGRSTPGADRCSCGGRLKELLIPFVRNRKILWDLPRPQAIRKYVLEQLPHYDL